jgi:hypothetical protein
MGATIRAKELILVTVEESHAGQRALVLGASNKFPLDDSDQAHVKDFYKALDSFVSASKIDRLALVGRISGGQFGGGSTGFKIEALLQLLPVTVEIIPAKTLATWEKKNPNGICTTKFAYQDQAGKVACLGLSRL